MKLLLQILKYHRIFTKKSTSALWNSPLRIPLLRIRAVNCLRSPSYVLPSWFLLKNAKQQPQSSACATTNQLKNQTLGNPQLTVFKNIRKENKWRRVRSRRWRGRRNSKHCIASLRRTNDWLNWNKKTRKKWRSRAKRYKRSNRNHFPSMPLNCRKILTIASRISASKNSSKKKCNCRNKWIAFAKILERSNNADSGTVRNKRDSINKKWV